MRPKVVNTPNYQNFVWQALREVREAESEGNPFAALMIALSLVDYLDVEIRDKIKNHAQAIQSVLDSVAANVNHPDPFISNVVLHTKLWRVSKVLLPLFLDKLTRLLSAEGHFMETQRGPMRVVDRGSLSLR